MALERNIKKKPARTADRRNVWLLILTTLLIGRVGGAVHPAQRED